MSPILLFISRYLLGAYRCWVLCSELGIWRRIRQDFGFGDALSRHRGTDEQQGMTRLQLHSQACESQGPDPRVLETSRQRKEPSRHARLTEFLRCRREGWRLPRGELGAFFLWATTRTLGKGFVLNTVEAAVRARGWPPRPSLP